MIYWKTTDLIVEWFYSTVDISFMGSIVALYNVT